MAGMEDVTGTATLGHNGTEKLTVPEGATVTATEKEYPGWTASISNETNSVITVTNTRDVASALTVKKVWITAKGVAKPDLTVTIGRAVEGGLVEKLSLIHI